SLHSVPTRRSSDLSSLLQNVAVPLRSRYLLDHSGIEGISQSHPAIHFRTKLEIVCIISCQHEIIPDFISCLKCVGKIGHTVFSYEITVHQREMCAIADCVGPIIG